MAEIGGWAEWNKKSQIFNTRTAPTDFEKTDLETLIFHKQQEFFDTHEVLFLHQKWLTYLYFSH